ncbi:MAG: hypothetical protein AAGE52_34895 [Myxococcota bacterium]
MLRELFGDRVDADAFAEGTVRFQEAETRRPEATCIWDRSTLSVTFPLPEAARPQPEFTHVALVWAVDGFVELVLTEGGDVRTPAENGRFPFAIAVTTLADVPAAEVEQLGAMLEDEFPNAIVRLLPAEGLTVDFARPRPGGLVDPSVMTEVLDLYAVLRDDARVRRFSLARKAFGDGDRFGRSVVLTADEVSLGCLRSFTAQPAFTIPSLADPLGEGQVFNVEECPIDCGGSPCR